MLSGEENYRRAVQFAGPEYLPCQIHLDLDWLYEQDESKKQRILDLQSRLPDDLLRLSVARNAREPETQDGVTRWTDEWGTGWANDGHGAKTERYPLLAGSI